MNKSQIINCVIIIFFLIAMIVDSSLKYPGYLASLAFFICMLSSGLGILSFMSFTFSDKQFNKQQLFWIIFLPTIGAVIFAFTGFYQTYYFRR